MFLVKNEVSVRTDQTVEILQTVLLSTGRDIELERDLREEVIFTTRTNLAYKVLLHTVFSQHSKKGKEQTT